MIEIRIPKEIKEYKSKWFFGLTIRQMISVIACFVLGGSLWGLVSNFLSTDLFMFLLLILLSPIFIIGFINYHGLTGEQLMLSVLKTYINPKRIWLEENIYIQIRNKIIL